MNTDQQEAPQGLKRRSRLSSRILLALMGLILLAPGPAIWALSSLAEATGQAAVTGAHAPVETDWPTPNADPKANPGGLVITGGTAERTTRALGGLGAGAVAIVSAGVLLHANRRGVWQ